MTCNNADIGRSCRSTDKVQLNLSTALKDSSFLTTVISLTICNNIGLPLLQCILLTESLLRLVGMELGHATSQNLYFPRVARKVMWACGAAGRYLTMLRWPKDGFDISDTWTYLLGSLLVWVGSIRYSMCGVYRYKQPGITAALVSGGIA